MKKKLRSAFLLESLEARLLFSADLAPVPVDGGNSGVEVESNLEISLRPDSGGVQATDTDKQERREVIFVDEAVDDVDRLIADLESQRTNGRQLDIVALDSDRDGIAQISEYLSRQQDVAAVHFISHGTDGEVVLGNNRLNKTTLDGYAEAIEGWQRALSSDADLLFYGCNLAAGHQGQDLVNSLTLITGADVAASDDVTGSAQFGGDWVLEYSKGEVETAVALSPETQQNWNGMLATFNVTTNNDGGAGSLRQAIIDANDLGGPNEIILPSDTYLLSLGELEITSELTITGADAGTTIIDGNDAARVFHLIGDAANLTLNDLTVQGGNSNKGSGIYVDHNLAQLTAARVIITGNIAGNGAGIFNDGTMTLTDVVVSNNGDAGTHDGGGIHNTETAILNRVTISDNRADDGGGIFNEGTINLTDVVLSNNGDASTKEGGGIHNRDVAVLNRVTLSGNRAEDPGGDGGGIHNDGTATSLSLTNVTFSNNSASDKGGGLHTDALVSIVNSTFTLNSATTGGGISQKSDTVNIKNTIVAENSASTDPDVEGSFNSQGYNLIGDKGTVTADFTSAGDQTGTAVSPVDPVLDSLKDNGGFTQTHLPLGGSPAVDAGTLAGPPAVDQRGIPRPLDGNGDTTAAVDIGAVEVVPDALVHVSDGDVQETSLKNRGSHQAAAMDAGGNYVVVWSSHNQDGSGWGVFARRFAASGSPLAPEFQVNVESTNDQQWATLAMDGSGRFAVAWTSASQDGSGNGVYLRRFDANGAAIDTNDLLVNSGITTANQVNPSVAVNAAGDLVIAWAGNGSGSEGIYAKQFDMASAAPGDQLPAVEIVVAMEADAASPAVDINSSGNFVVTWNENGSLWAQRFDSGGNPVGSRIAGDVAGSAAFAAVVLHDSGDFSIAHRSYFTGVEGIYLRRYDNIAEDWYSPFPDKISSGASDHTSPSITKDSAGNFIIVWEGSGDGDSSGVFARKFDPNGTALTNQFQINQTITGSQHMASVAMVDSDCFVVVWSGNGPDDGSGVYQRIYGTPTNNAPVIDDATFDVDENSTNGTSVGTVPVTDPDAGDTHVYTITAGNTGGAFAIDNSGNITVANSAALNFETTPVFTLTVQVQDQGGTGLTDTATITVNLNDINEAPVINNSTFSVDENAANGTMVGTVAATDSGPADNYTMLYWVDVQTDELRRINLDGTGNEQLAIQADGTAATGMRSVAVDDVNGKVYWVNNNSDQIWRANLDGSSPERILSGIVWPMGIAVDAAGEKIYWFDNNSSELWWADLDGANAAALITAGINNPKALTIDAIGGKLYWTDRGLDTIMRANLNGSNLETVVAGLDDPYGIALDTPAGKVYWAEPTLGEIQRADMVVGATAETVITGLSQPRAVTVDTINGKLYYVDAGVDRIERANLDGSAIEIVTATGDWPVSLAIGPPVQNLTYAITGGNTNGAFTIDSVTGAITVANSSELDFETTPVFNLTVTVTDAGGLADSATITINLNNLNEMPVINDATFNIDENSTNGTAVGNVPVTDPDAGDTHVYSITAGNTGSAFAIDNSGNITVANSSALNFETTPVFTLTVEVQDLGGTGLIDTAAITVNLNNLNEMPVINDATFNIDENSTNGTAVGNVPVTDPDAGDTHVYSITAGNTGSAFAIDNSGNITVANSAALNFETTPVFTLTVEVQDLGGTGLIDTAAITVNLNNLNEMPVINDATFNIDENSTNGTAVGNVPVTDPDAGDTHVYSITAGNTGSAFAIDNSGNITVANSSALNFETTPVFTLTVEVQDLGGTGLIDTAAITVNLNNLNEMPVINDATFNIDENSTNGTAVGNVPVTDPDAGDTHVYSITAGNTGSAFAVDNSGNITVANSAALNFETTPVFTLTVEVQDLGGTGLIDTAAITVNLNNLNEMPVINDATFNIDENSTNGTAVGNVPVTDPDAGDTHVYSITAGNTGSAFAVDNSGNITVANSAALNFETTPVFTLTVEVQDLGGTGLIDTAAITVNLNNLNEMPVINDATFNIDENSTNGTAVGNVPVTDPDAGDTHVYSISAGNTGTAFAIDNSGNITVANSAALNFETTPVFTLTVEVQDLGGTGLIDTAAITVNLNNLNEMPVINDATFNIDENSTNGTAVGNVPVTDPDAGDTHVYSITAGNTGSAFAVDNSGNITVANSAALNFETTPVFTLTVEVQDLGGTGLIDTAAITVNLNNLNEMPVINDATFNIDENSTNGTAVGNVPVTDPDAGDTHVYSITAGNTGSAFAIDNSGNITVANSAALNFETTPVFTLTVEVQDLGGTGLIDTAAITVNLNNLNEMPVINDATFNIDENSTNGTAVGNVPVTDPDAGDTHVYSISAGNTGTAFAIDNSGNITVANSAALNFETTPVFTLTVEVQDLGGTGLIDTAAITVNLNNLNEMPVINDATFNIDENSTNGTAVGNVPVTDPDAGDTHVYSISAGNIGGAVAIDNAGNITVANSAALNFEIIPVFTLTVQVQDQGGTGLTDTATITVNLNDINDAGTVTIDNSTPAQGDTLTANVVDPDGASGAITYQWFSDGAVIGGADGKTYTTTQSDVDAVMTVTAIYTDDQGTAESLTSAATAAVTNVNDTPVAVNDYLNATEDQSIAFASITDLLGNDSDIDGDALTLSGFTQPANGMLVDNGDGTLTYTPAGNFHGTDSFTYTINDGNGGTASGTAIIVVAPVGDIPQVTNVSTDAEVQSGLIFINRNASDGAEISHFKISGITNGALYLADGVTRIDNGDYITVAQGQAGLRFTPTAGSVADGSFNVESSEDGVSVAPQSGIATSMITVMTPAPAPPPPEPQQGLLLSEPEIILSEEVVEEETEDVEDPVDEADVKADADNMLSVETPQLSKAPGTTKPSFNPGIAFLGRGDLDSDDDKTPDRSTRLSPQTLKMLIETENLGELKTVLKKLGITTLSPEDYELVRSSLDAIKDEMGKEILLGKTVLGSAIATSVGLSAGYVVWMLKGGSLLASLLSSLPAWQLADPLAILVGKKEDEDDDDDSLKTIIEEGSGRDEDKESNASDLDNLKKESVKR